MILLKNSEIKVQAFPISKKLNVNQKVFYSGNKNKPKKEKEDIKINKDFTEMTILEKNKLYNQFTNFYRKIQL